MVGHTTQDTGIAEQGQPYFSAFGLTDTGKIREHNEDAFLCLLEHGAFCVADGMGGMRDGALASRTTVACIEQAFTALSVDPSAPPPTFAQRRDTLVTALEEANRRMQPQSSAHKQKRSGATVVALLLDAEAPHNACVVHAGDSRLYRLRGSHLEQMTQDHSAAILFEKLRGRFKNSALQADLQGVVTRGIGLKTTLEYEQTDIELRSQDLLLLCSDGLTNMVKSAAIQRILETGWKQRDPLAQTCDRLIKAANDAGGHDNITVIVIRIGEIPEPVTTETTVTEDVDPDNTAVVTPTNPEIAGPLKWWPWFLDHKPVAISAIAGVVTVFLLLVVSIRSCRPDQDAPHLEKPETLPESSPKTSREALLKELEQVLEEALDTGDWQAAQARIDAGHARGILNADDHSLALHRQIAAWYALWIQATVPSFEPSHEFEELRDRHLRFLQLIDPVIATRLNPVSPDRWPTDRTESAKLYCVTVHRLQRRVAEELSRTFAYYGDLIQRSKQVRADPANMRNETQAQQRKKWIDDAEILWQKLRKHIIALTAIRDFPWAGTRISDYAWTDLLATFRELQAHEAAYYAIETAFIDDSGPLMTEDE